MLFTWQGLWMACGVVVFWQVTRGLLRKGALWFGGPVTTTG